MPHVASSQWFRIGAVFVLLVIVVVPFHGQSSDSAGKTPSQIIDLASHGFNSTSGWQETFADDLGIEPYASQIAIEFLDEDHLLVAFSKSGLIKRLPECPPSHHDRYVRAMLFELPSGKLLRQTDWYLHDHRRFLWPLASGSLLLRRGDTLLLVDSEFRERELLRSTEPLEWVSTSADGQQVLVETKTQQVPPQKVKYELRFLDSSSGSVISTLPLVRPVPVTTTSSGFPDAVSGFRGTNWLIRFGSTPSNRLPITRVRSACAPVVNFSAGNTMLIARCTSSGKDYVVSSFTSSGHFLWRRRWEQSRWVPLVARSASGIRFALSAMVRDGVDDSGVVKDPEAGQKKASIWTQHIEVLGTLDGSTLVSADTKPAVFAGQSFALSSKGSRFAVLRGTTVEVYSLPAPTRDEEQKVAAVMADMPGLIPPADENYQELAESIDSPEGIISSTSAGTMATANAMAPATGVAPMPSQSGAPAPTADSSGAPLTTFRTGTQVVVLEVVVTDKKGKPITGLKQDQFTVLEDGKQQGVRLFEEHLPEVDKAKAAAETQKSAPPPQPSNTFSNVSQKRQPDSSTMLMLDLLNTPLTDRQRVRDELVKFIKNKPPEENFAVCVLGNNLRLVRGFTNDEKLLIAGVQSQRGNLPSIGSGAGLSSAEGLIQRIIGTDMSVSTPMGTKVNAQMARFVANAEQSYIDDRSQQQDMRVRATFDAFQQVARYLAGIPGRKNLVWLSSSFPSVVFSALNAEGTDPFKQQRDWTEDVKRLTTLLAAGHVAVYPVGIQGVQTDSMFDVESRRQPGAVAGMSPTQGIATSELSNTIRPGDPFATASRDSFLELGATRATMDTFAEQTGGKAFYGTNDLSAAIRSAVQDGTSYYTLSYTPLNKKYRGEFRKIRVKVQGGDYKLAYRTGYYADDPNKPIEHPGTILATMQSAAMSHGAPESSQIPFTVRVVPVGEPTMKVVQVKGKKPKEAKEATASVKMQHYLVNYVVSGTQLRFNTTQDGSIRGDFNFLIKGFDEDGLLLAVGASKAASTPKPEQYENIMRTGFRMKQEIDIPVNAAYVRLAVEDVSNAHIGTLELSLPIPTPKDEPLVRKAKTLPPVEPE